MTSSLLPKLAYSRTGTLIFPILNVRDVCLECLDLIFITFKPPRPDHAPIVIVIQSEHLKQSISPKNQSAKHPDSGCFSISGVVIGSALSKGWRSGPEAFRTGHFLRLDRNRKPRMESLRHPGYAARGDG